MFIFLIVLAIVVFGLWFRTITERDRIIEKINILSDNITKSHALFLNNIAEVNNKYKHLICNHSFKNPNGTGEVFKCNFCGMKNPKYDWRYIHKDCMATNLDGWEYAYMDTDGTQWFYKEKSIINFGPIICSNIELEYDDKFFKPEQKQTISVSFKKGTKK